MTLRKPETQARYEAVLKENTGRALDAVPALRRFRHWKIIPNDFPYDLVFQKHHMLLPKRIVADKKDLTRAEWDEYERIVALYVPHHYDCVMENTHRKRSVLSHFHVHLLEYR